MKATLINYTPDAVETLLFTKSTRLNMSPGLYAEIAAWPETRKMEELAYMAATIPSSWEFVDYIFLFEGVSRACTHQLVRTRTAAFAQQSLRVVDAGDFDFVMPDRFELGGDNCAAVHGHNARTALLYKLLVSAGAATEDARSILPTNIATNIVAKYNLRTLSELARSRTGGRTQGEYIAVINAAIDEVLKVHPWASMFLFSKPRDFFAEIEAFAERQFGGDLRTKGELLKIVDAMRKGAG